MVKSTFHSALVCLVLIAFTSGTSAKKRPEKPLLKYQGKTELPDDLYETYAALAKVLKTADRGDIERFCLPGSIRYTTESRKGQYQEYGHDMNLHFLKSGFHADILNLMKLSEDAFLIRTGTSYLRFVRTKTSGWKLYDYGDKPIE